MINDPQITQIAQMEENTGRDNNLFPNGGLDFFIKAGSSMIFLR